MKDEEVNYLADWNDFHPEETQKNWKLLDDLFQYLKDLEHNFKSEKITIEVYELQKNWISDIIDSNPDEHYFDQYK